MLLVDDTPDDRELAREALNDHEQDLILDTCASGEHALTFLRAPGTTLPDVILLNLNMPGLTAFEVLTTMKDDPNHRVIPVMILSNSSDTDDIARAYTLHASSYLIKNLNFQRFMQQINAFVTSWHYCVTVTGFGPVS